MTIGERILVALMIVLLTLVVIETARFLMALWEMVV